jgi:anti-sigma factor RsiW
MTCRELVDCLGDYVAGDLSPGERARFDAHLRACPECVAYLASYRSTLELEKLAFDHPDDPVPGSVPEELLRAVVAARRRG